ncbi:MAG: pteridine reductase [Moraxella sp.]|uniref:pteridine reductase n=1 Tax=Moraxella sp. TaxID=479 RepID=UPI0026DC7D5B|nr:pteridine reductase [Moraxella sp.]MDO4450951.1 pteridine reductase [Moraxella sp.]
MNNDTNPKKVALITGGSKRIGKQITKILHKNGYQVIIHHHESADNAKSLCDELNAIRPSSAKIIGAELSFVNDKAKSADFKNQVLNLFGRVDCIIHNASSFYPSDLADNFDVLQNHWDDLFLTNAKAPFFISQLFLDELIKNNGQIISILDIHADNKPFIGYPIYTMAKTAHKAMVHSLALQLAPNVRVNGVSPGVNVLPIEFNEQQANDLLNSVPLKQIGTPNDIAMTVLFLLNSPYITGQVIAVDGGRSLTLSGQ